MAENLLWLLLGLLCAGGGGELFIRGAVGLASWARIPAGIVGATVAAFATSSPSFGGDLLVSCGQAANLRGRCYRKQYRQYRGNSGNRASDVADSGAA
jgi:hypothetical protein